MGDSFRDLLNMNHGHFKLESGMHGDVWFSLDEVYAEPKRLEPLIAALSRLVARHEIDAVCGALTGGAFVGYSIAVKLGVGFLYTERFERRSKDNELEVEYRLARGLRSLAAGVRVAVVDDVINAGSAVLKTSNELVRYGAHPIVMASLLTVGGDTPKRLAGSDLPIVALDHLRSNLWQPRECPLCGAGERLIDPYEA